MYLGGLQKLSIIDYPNKTAATVFTIGCNFRCPYCHNPELVDCTLNDYQKISEKEFFKFLDSRRNLLDGVCITGGEPTLQPELTDFISRIKNEGFLVKLDTNGARSKVLNSLFNKNLVDYVAMDIKTSPWRYGEVAGGELEANNVIKSALLIRQSGVDYQFRTTAVPNLITEKEIREIGRWIRGAKLFTLQQFRPEKTLDWSARRLKPYPEAKLRQFEEIMKNYVEKTALVGF